MAAWIETRGPAENKEHKRVRRPADWLKGSYKKGRATSCAPFRSEAMRYCCGLGAGELWPVVSDDAGGMVLPRGALAMLLAGGVFTTGAFDWLDAVVVSLLDPPNMNTSSSTSTTAPAIQPHMA